MRLVILILSLRVLIYLGRTKVSSKGMSWLFGFATRTVSRPEHIPVLLLGKAKKCSVLRTLSPAVEVMTHLHEELLTSLSCPPATQEIQMVAEVVLAWLATSSISPSGFRTLGLERVKKKMDPFGLTHLRMMRYQTSKT
jgi:hypothetical protein